MHRPPQFFLRFFRWFCDPDLQKPIEGDLMELHEERVKEYGKTRADLSFILDVLQLFRSNIIKPLEGTHRLNTYGMFKNYFKVGYRNLLRSKGYAFINISGLALGLAVSVLISLWIVDEVTYDQHHSNYDRIAQVMQHRTVSGDKRTQEPIPMPLGEELRLTYGSDFEYVVMSSRQRNHILMADDGNQSIVKEGKFMEKDAASMLSLNMLQGSWQDLNDPTAIFISVSASKALFGITNSLDQLIKIDNRQNTIVKGVYEDIPHNSQFEGLDFIANWEGYINSSVRLSAARENPQWDNSSFLLYTQIAENADMEQVSEKIKLVKYNKLPEDDRIFDPEVFLHPMKDWRLRSNWEQGIKTGGFITYVRLFGVVGLFVLALACINFTNLSTASSQRRAKEVGIRKTMGSNRHQLISQFLSESSIISFIAFAVALILVYISLPFFNNLADKQIAFPMFNPTFWVYSMVFLLFISLLAGSYPAFYLSSFNPVGVLKGTIMAKPSSGLFRKVLVVLQFTVSVVLIIATLIVKNQIDHAKNRTLGYDYSSLISISMNTPGFYSNYELLRTELIGRNAIVDISLASSPITDVWHNAAGYEWEGRDPGFNPQMAHIRVTPNYGRTLGWEIIEGRDFHEDYASDSLSFILSETAVKHLDFENPIGKSIRWMDKPHRVVGVVKDMLMESPFDPIKPTVYEVNSGRRTGWMNIKLNPQQSMETSMADVREVFNTHLANAEPAYLFVDDIHNRKFAQVERIDRLSAIFATLAIFISCLGLFGLTTFMVERRSKEISIRKVLGASVQKIWKIILWEFLILIGISCLIAIPISFILLDDWLQGFDYRTEIGVEVFIYACLGALAIAVVTVSFQSLKAASANPVKTLRSQ